MDKMITTLAEMPAVAGQALNSLVGKGGRAKRRLRRAGTLSVCLGALILGQNAHAGFADELFTYMGIQVVEYGIDDAIGAINNNADNGQGVTGTLLSILGGTTDGKLDNISSQITVAQDMIAGLQANMNAFEANVAGDFQAVIQGQDQAAYQTAMAPVVSSATKLANLYASYTNVIGSCYTNMGTNWVLKSQLSGPEIDYLTRFATGAQLQNTPDMVLQALQTASTRANGTACIYDSDLNLLKVEVPFEHQTYAGMYDLFNYMASLRATALYFKKEYLSYQFSLLSGTNNSYADYMTLNFTPAVTGQNGAVTYINSDVATNAILTKMATLLTNTVATNGTQRLAYLATTISTNLTFTFVDNTSKPVSPTNQPVYKVICNADGREYVIPTQSMPIPPYGFYADPPSQSQYPVRSADGRYQLAYAPADLSGLLAPNLSGDPFAYLTSVASGWGNLTNITQANGIILARTDNEVKTGGAMDVYFNKLYLLDAQNYTDGHSPVQYLTWANNSQQVTSQDVDNARIYPFSSGQIALNQVPFLSIYCDTHVSAFPKIAVNPTTKYYTPPDITSMTGMEGVFSLANGDVLNLAGLSGTITNTIRICGNATIIGGGANKTISGLTIETYGGNLTVSNLCLLSSGTIIHNINGPLTLVAMGSNSLSTTASAAVVSDSGNNLTFSGSGSLTIANTSAANAANGYSPNLTVRTTSGLYISGASNLTFSTLGSTSIQAGPTGTKRTISVVNSKVTSRVGVESDNEFIGNVQLQDSALDMSYGTINPSMTGTITWLGKIRSSSRFTIQQSPYVFPFGQFLDAIYIKLVGTAGTSEFENMNYDGTYYLGSSGSATFSLSYSIASAGVVNFQGLGKLLSIQMYKQDDMWTTWTFESADIAPNVSGDVSSSYHVAGNNFTFNTTATSTFPAVEQNNPWNYTINADNVEASITGYTGPAGSVSVPSAIHGYAVTSIGAAAFQGHPGLSGITIANGVTSIGNDAFFGCTNLTSVTLGNTITNIGAYAFYNCSSLPSVLIPESVTGIGDYAFQLCSNLAGIYFQGNAPSQVGVNVFNGDTQATVYRFSGTSHWPGLPGNWNDCPTALWLTVNGGTDGGSYTNLHQVTITANAPVASGAFDQWSGATQYVASVTSSNTTVNMPTRPVTLTATYYQAPFITAHPASQTVVSGGNATFSVVAGGTAPLAYQWYFNGTNISGATATSHSLSGVTLADAGDYMVRVANLYGSVISSVARLTHISAPPGYNQVSGLLLGAGEMRLSFVGIPGWNYALDRSFSLSPAEWVPQATNLAGAGGTLIFTNTPDPTTNNFWRVRFAP